MMRYIITKELRSLIWENRNLLNSSNLSLKYKNWFYVNKSISEEDFNSLCNFLKINKNRIKLKIFEFNYEKNLGKYAKIKKINFKGVNKDFAEFTGIMLGDGNIYKNCLSIILDNREKQYITYIKSLFLKLFGFNFKFYNSKTQNRIRLYVYSKNLVELLLKFGLKRGNKILYGAIIPIWIKQNKSYLKSCLRGLIDTDGCVYQCKKDTKPYIGFKSYCNPLLNDFYTGFKELGYHFVKSGRGNLVLCRKSEIKTYLNEINFSNLKHKLKFDGVVL